MTAPSAKPLFKAISGAARRTEPQRRLMELPDGYPEKAERRAHDFYPTGQPEAIRALLVRDGKRILPLREVREPAIGAGDLARPMWAGFTRSRCRNGWRWSAG